jgi:hypothetical protein
MMFGSRRALKSLQYCYSMIKDEVQFTDAFTKVIHVVDVGPYWKVAREV